MGSFRIMIFLWIINLLAFPLEADDTLWTRTYGGLGRDVGYSVQQTSDGGYIIAGYTNSFGAGSWDVYLIRVNREGDTLWTKTYGGIGSDIAFSVQQTSDGGYVIAGRTESSDVKGDVYLVKTDAKGDTLWTKTYGGIYNDGAGSVEETSDGGYIIAGFTYSFSMGFGDVYLIKTNGKGDTLWTRNYGGMGEDWGVSVQQTRDKGYIITGFTWSFGTRDNWDVYLIKTDPNGDTSWTRTYGGRGDDMGLSVQQTSDNGYIIAGATTSFGAGWTDVYLIKTDKNGDTLWTRVYGGEGNDFGYSVQQTSDGGYIIIGSSSSFSAGDTNIYLIRTDTRGDALWTRIYGGVDEDWGTSVQQTSDGGYIITGGTVSFGAGDADVYLIKIKPETGIREKVKRKRQSAKLDAYLNPFNQKIVISYQVPAKAAVSLKIYNVSGRLVRTLPSTKGLEQRVIWDRRDDSGKRVTNGIYFLRLETEKQTLTRKLVIII